LIRTSYPPLLPMTFGGRGGIGSALQAAPNIVYMPDGFTQSMRTRPACAILFSFASSGKRACCAAARPCWKVLPVVGQFPAAGSMTGGL